MYKISYGTFDGVYQAIRPRDRRPPKTVRNLHKIHAVRLPSKKWAVIAEFKTRPIKSTVKTIADYLKSRGVELHENLDYYY